MRTVPQIFGVLVVTGVTACFNPIAPATYPEAIHFCERNTATVCGSWTLQNGEYHVTWADNAASRVQVVRFTETDVEFQRTDVAKNADFTARYIGTVNRRTARGTVTWSQYGTSWNGTWSAEW